VMQRSRAAPRITEQTLQRSLHVKFYWPGRPGPGPGADCVGEQRHRLYSFMLSRTLLYYTALLLEYSHNASSRSQYKLTSRDIYMCVSVLCTAILRITYVATKNIVPQLYMTCLFIILERFIF
jgi:hypothetical protein